ncbi:F-box/LRR-repeat protein 21-like [Ruditapes philippinarum]|uniref:F-box/LRR-repeat protein 21-like n=1 Tax=Ruditapes philippinarum TaxID=129788 RepID=UPI00295ADAF9|nr:F-box/LRR-repeat protein 21-like [Ruditapes philippinarum]
MSEGTKETIAEWTNLPEVILGNIFSYLPTVDRLCIGGVCKAWENAVHRPEVWECFEFSEKDVDEFGNGLDVLRRELSFTHLVGSISKAIVEKYVSVIKQFGRSFRRVKILFRGRHSNRILYTLSNCCLNITNLSVQLMQQNDQVHDCCYIQAIHNIILRNSKLEQLYVRDIDNYSESDLPFEASHSYTIKELTIIQSFEFCNLENFMSLVNLRELALEPHFLSYSLLYHLASRSLIKLHILAISKHMEFYNEALQDWQWQEIKKQGPELRVCCLFRVGHEWTTKDIMLKKEIPIKCLRYVSDIKYELLNYPVLTNNVCNYSSTLVEFIDFSHFLKNYELALGDRSMRLELNRCILKIVLGCTLLRTLAVKEVLYSQNILFMLSVNKHLDIFLREEQIEYAEFNSDLLHPMPYEEFDLISRSWVNFENFKFAVLQLTNKHWNFYTEGSAMYENFVKKHFKLL